MYREKSERERLAELSIQKEKEFAQRNDTFHKLLTNCQEELKSANEKIAQLTASNTELVTRNSVYAKEGENLKQVCAQQNRQQSDLLANIRDVVSENSRLKTEIATRYKALHTKCGDVLADMKGKEADILASLAVVVQREKECEDKVVQLKAMREKYVKLQ